VTPGSPAYIKLAREVCERCVQRQPWQDIAIELASLFVLQRLVHVAGAFIRGDARRLPTRKTTKKGDG